MQKQKHMHMKKKIVTLAALVLVTLCYATDFKLFCHNHTGIDVSHHNAHLDWEQLEKVENVEFVISSQPSWLKSSRR